MENKAPRLSEAMDKLDTLSGGIVFDKEGAWDKLQERLEKKPAKKIKLFYWSAAAASLLLLVAVVIGNNKPEQLTVNTPIEAALQQQSNNVVPAQELPIVIQQNNVVTNNAAAYKRKTSVHISKPQQLPEAQVTIAVNTPPVVQPEPTTHKPAEEIVMVRKPIKVVHINDVINEDNITRELKSPAHTKSATVRISIPLLRINSAHVDNEHQNSLLYIQ